MSEHKLAAAGLSRSEWELLGVSGSERELVRVFRSEQK
jgi:hypothetical protein